MTTNDSQDHRVRTAERRRNAMRQRLVESALFVFAEKGVDASVIDDVIRTAGVSRGSFYKYFATTHELMVAASVQLGNELLAAVETRVHEIEDPAERVAVGISLFIKTALAFPVFAKFTLSSGLEAAGPATLIYDYLPAHLEEGISRGRFTRMPIEVGLDLITGSVLLCVARAVAGSEGGARRHDVVAAILRGLGMSPAEAANIAKAPVPSLELAENGLFRRSHRRFVESDEAA